jgi:hypothetical protein
MKSATSRATLLMQCTLLKLRRGLGTDAGFPLGDSRDAGDVAPPLSSIMRRKPQIRKSNR